LERIEKRGESMAQRNSRTIKVAVIKGEGIGPEIINASLTVLDAIQDTCNGLTLEYVFADAGLQCIPTHGTTLPEETKKILKECDCCLKGPITNPGEPGSR